MLGGAVKTAQIDEVRRAAGRDDVRNKAHPGKAFTRRIEEALCRRPPVQRRIEHQSAEFQPRVALYDACQLHRLCRGFNTGPFLPGVTFDKHANRTLGGAPGV